MIQTDTTWDDSGYDCDHCGGEVLKRTDYETGRPPDIRYQCRRCGCQWAPDGDLLRVGGRRRCRRAARAEAPDGPAAWLTRYGPSLVFGLLVLFILLRLGGGALLRVLLPLLLVGVVVFLVVRYGREQAWW